MRIYKIFAILSLISACMILQSCARTSDDVWENTKSAGRHMQRGVRALTGKHGDSRQIQSRNEFDCIEDEELCADPRYQELPYQDRCQAQLFSEEYVPLQDQDNEELAMADIVAPPPRETPGEPGSSIPSIEAFRDPNTIPRLANIFRTIYFSYDSSLIKGQNNLQIIHQIADYMRTHENSYLFIEGHTDERGPQAYNLALGSRRSNAVRNLLIGESVNPDHIFTISYGKERPVVLERHEEGWSKNRRAEFKIYER
jgi:peptidoglycan-associated lipoprotein